MDKKTDDELAKILWDYNCMPQPLKKSDAIVVLGSNDIRVAEYGAQLLLQDYAPLLIFSGNEGRLTHGLWNKPEAEIFAEKAIQMGVPEKKIFIENKSTNTGENIQFTKRLIQKKRITAKRLTVVHKPYMTRRTNATFKKIWPEIEILVSSPDISYEDYPNRLISRELLINILVGDTQRIKLYSQKGFQIYQEMPDDVWQAHEELVKRGYVKHLVDSSSA